MQDVGETLLARYAKARERRGLWESHWQECYDYALPMRDGSIRATTPGEKKTDRLFDGTAPDAVDQLAASLLAQLTPPWTRWFGLSPGPELSDEERDQAAPVLETMAARIQTHFDRSNFAVEIHQCYLDLVTAGTASLLFEAAPPGSASAFRFTAIPLGQVALEEGASGRLDATFRRSEVTLTTLEARFPDARLPDDLLRRGKNDPDLRIPVIEAVLPDKAGYLYAAFLENDAGRAGAILRKGKFSATPFINFRWLKAPGESYGRSPVMKALPDIKTANKVVELILKNATIAVTGIWQADDDGVLNPANIKLAPGTIIPKAVGSAGLTPLESPGRFDVSQLVLDDLRARIRHALLIDSLGQEKLPRMTATEVLERSGEMARVLGATYGRLQCELLNPLIERALAILRRRGEIPDLFLDGRIISLSYRSPLAQRQAQQDAQSTLTWINALAAMGPAAAQAIDYPAVARWLARALDVPEHLVPKEVPATSANGLPAPEASMDANALTDLAQTLAASAAPLAPPQ